MITGMHRSGTSSVANALHKLGVYLGEPEDLLAANDFNTEGYYEHLGLLELDNSALSAFGMSYERADPITEDWLELPQAEKIVTEICNTLVENFDGHEIWGWKEPRTALLLSFYNAAFRRLALDPHYVICVRNPFSVVASLARREGFSRNHSLGLWLLYTLSALKHSMGHSRTVVLYEDYLADPETSLRSVVDAIKGWNPNRKAWDSAFATVREDLNHGNQTEKEAANLRVLAKRTLDLCQKAATGQGHFRAGAYDSEIDELWDFLIEAVAVFAPPVRQGIFLIFWQTKSLNYNTIQYRPSPLWQTIKAEIPAPALSLVGGAFYDMPCAVWIRKAIWRHNGKETHAEIMAGRHAKISDRGDWKLLAVAFGQEQFVVKTPSEKGPYELEIEFYLEANPEITRGYIAHKEQELARALKLSGGPNFNVDLR